VATPARTETSKVIHASDGVLLHVTRPTGETNVPKGGCQEEGVTPKRTPSDPQIQPNRQQPRLVGTRQQVAAILANMNHTHRCFACGGPGRQPRQGGPLPLQTGTLSSATSWSASCACAVISFWVSFHARMLECGVHASQLPTPALTRFMHVDASGQLVEELPGEASDGASPSWTEALQRLRDVIAKDGGGSHPLWIHRRSLPTPSEHPGHFLLCFELCCIAWPVFALQFSWLSCASSTRR
jgi:hypothetical protein